MNHPYKLPELPYSNDALDPYIDAKTMQLHHGAHHKAYVDKLNKALENHPEWQKKVEELLVSLDRLPADLRKPVHNNAGQHANHTLFWSILGPKAEGKASGEVAKKIDGAFGNFDTFKEKFTNEAVNHFGSGWAWLVTDKEGKLSVMSTHDQENPLSKGLVPLLVIDVWEHAYYLKYQNRRPEFVQAFWNIVNWNEVQARWDEFTKTGTSLREWRFVKG